MTISRKWRVWLSGIAQGCIHGGATMVGTTLGISGASAVGIPVPQLTFKQFGIGLVVASVSGGAAYLRQSPWPKDEDGTDVWKLAKEQTSTPPSP